MSASRRGPRPISSGLHELLDADVLGWMTEGACNGLATRSDDPWFAEVGCSEQTASARRICLQCPVRERCMDFALTHRVEHGVWGATTPRQRRRMLSLRESAA